jgi:hypothetical protein
MAREPEDGLVRIREDAVAWREVGDEMVALDVARSTYLAVNRTGAVLWQELARGATPAALADLIAERFGIERERAIRDVQAFLDDLRQRGLLEER